MEGSLLSHIAENFISQYENVANSSLAFMLNQYLPAREALKTILKEEKVPKYYITELSTRSNGRPDITGLDPKGNKLIIIEGKFWAKLTDNQPNNYLKELDKNGKLLFLAPEKRITSLKHDINNRIGKEDERILVHSWSDIINIIKLKNEKKYDPQLSSDLSQFKKLCSKMDSEGLPPLSMSDLDPMNGRINYQFCDVIDECKMILKKWKSASFEGLQSGAYKGNYGFYFESGELCLRLCVDNYYWYKRRSHTPFWLYIKDVNWKKSTKIFQLLNRYDQINSYDDGSSSDYGIILRPGMDKEQIINQIIGKVKNVINFINQHW